MTAESPRCVAPLDDAGERLCAAPATAERTVEGLVMPLCAEHAADAESHGHGPDGPGDDCACDACVAHTHEYNSTRARVEGGDGAARAAVGVPAAESRGAVVSGPEPLVRGYDWTKPAWVPSARSRSAPWTGSPSWPPRALRWRGPAWRGNHE